MGGGGSSPTPPKFNPVDIGSALSGAEQADTNSWRLMDEDYVKRFPGLVAARDADINTAYKNLTDPVSPATQNQMATRSIENSLFTTGGNDPMATIGGKGSASGNSFGLNLANEFQSNQDYNRNAWMDIVSQNQPRAIGGSGSDYANLSIFNTQGQAGASQANYAAGVSNANARSAANAANTQAAIATAVSVAGIIAAI